MLHLPLRLPPLARDRRLVFLVRFDRLLDGALAGCGGFEHLTLASQLLLQSRDFHLDAEQAQQEELLFELLLLPQQSRVLLGLLLLLLPGEPVRA